MSPTHASWSRAFSSSVTPSAFCIYETIHASRSTTCSFRSARYVQSFPDRSSALYWPGRCSCRNALCIRPHLPMGGFPPASPDWGYSSLPPMLIVRGKVKAPVEFGAKFDLSLDSEGYGRIEKISFEAYNESTSILFLFLFKIANEHREFRNHL